MIEELLIKNFQTHEKLKICFDPSITVIVGKTDSGKSSVIRALRWVLMNQPRGSAFVKHGEDSVGVKVKIDGEVLTRSKEGESNHYSLGESSWTAFGTNVPEPIEKFLRLDELNFQQQHDAPFWLSLSSGEVSRRLNSIVDLEIIDRTISGVKSKLLGQKKLVEGNLTRLRSEKTILESFDWVTKAESDFNQIVESEATLETQKRLIESCESQLTEIVNLSKTSERKTEALEVLKGIGKRGRSCQVEEERIENLGSLLSSCVKTQIKATQSPPDVEPLVLGFEKCEKLRRRSTLLHNHLAEIFEAEKTAKIDFKFPDLDEHVKEYQELKKRRTALLLLLGEIKEILPRVKNYVDPDFPSIEAGLATAEKISKLEKVLSTIKSLSVEIHNKELRHEDLETEIQIKSEGKCPICGKSLS